MNLKDAETLALSKMKEHGLTDWTFKFNKRKRSLGFCCYTIKEIQLSKYFTKLNDEQTMLNTIMHEIAHALDTEKAHHGKNWKRIALSIGCNAKRTAKNVISPKSKYISLCNSCGTIHKRNRISKSSVSCGVCCKNRFSERFILKFKLNKGKQINPVIVTRDVQLKFDNNIFA